MKGSTTERKNIARKITSINYVKRTDINWGIWGIPREFPKFPVPVVLTGERGMGKMTKNGVDRLRTVPREFGEFPGNSRGIPVPVVLTGERGNGKMQLRFVVIRQVCRLFLEPTKSSTMFVEWSYN